MYDIRETPEFTKWESGLKDRVARKRIQTRILRFQLGNLGDVKSVGEGVREARIPYGPGYRIYFTNVEETLVVLLCGGDKSTQSMDIKKAKVIKKELEL